jgi:hypothetical protein
MTHSVFLAPAEEEMREAAEYYERQTRGLGHEFLAEVQRTVVGTATDVLQLICRSVVIASREHSKM